MKKLCAWLLALLLIQGLPAAAISSVKMPVEPAYACAGEPVSAHAPEAALADEAIKQVYSIEEAGVYLRQCMKLRQETVQMELITEDYHSGILDEVVAVALQHTGVPDEGDYLQWQYYGWDGSLGGYSQGDMNYLTLTYQLRYYTTLEQEQTVDAKIAQLLDQWDLEGSSDYDKIRTVYNWLTNHVVYDNEHLGNSSYKLKHTAYAALEHGTSVCQGYSVLMYRLLLELGIDNRLIFGISQNQAHSWNIVELDGLYYDMDATWDASRHQAGLGYKYFLCCQLHFDDHARDAVYDTDAFNAAYPMTEADFGPPGHHYTETVTEATCTEGGFTTHICQVCENTYIDHKTDALGHSWDEGTVTKEPTEESTGLRLHTCATCGETQETEIPKKEHVHHYASQVAAPTCTEKGYTTHTCSGCGDSYQDSQTSALGHNWDEGTVTKEPTEESTGLRLHTCATCGETQETEIPKKEHVHHYASQVTAPTCTEKGYTTYTCACGDSYQADYVDVIDHSYEVEDWVLPTCTEPGCTIYACLVCDRTYHEESGEPTGHSYDAVVTAPTCTAEGYTTYTCIDCDESYTDDTTAMVNHSWDEGTVTKEPTENAAGLLRQTCLVCAEIKETVIPELTHVHSYTDSVTAPTCAAQGYTTHTCACGDSFVDAYVEPAGHDFGEWAKILASTCTEQGQERRECAECGEIETNALPLAAHATAYASDADGHWLACTNCDYTKQAEAHSYANGNCTACGYADPNPTPTEPVPTEPAPTQPTEPAPTQPQQGTEEPELPWTLILIGGAAVVAAIGAAAVIVAKRRRR